LHYRDRDRQQVEISVFLLAGAELLLIFDHNLLAVKGEADS
jgi:hypothetical protein